MKRTEVPQQGLLQDVRVVVSAISVAGPFAGEILADMGADVIQLENPKNPDFSHGNGLPGWQGESHRRNMRDITLDVTKPKGREAFLKLMADTDIFIESSKGGQWAAWGLTDETLWEVNPALVIAHISGYGQTGLESYISRASFDPIAQAFSGIAMPTAMTTPRFSPSPTTCWTITQHYLPLLPVCLPIFGHAGPERVKAWILHSMNAVCAHCANICFRTLWSTIPSGVPSGLRQTWWQALAIINAKRAVCLSCPPVQR